MTRTSTIGASAAVLLVSVACGSSSITQPPGKPPSPTSVTVSEPGGDAHDAHFAALTRQLEQPWGARNDKDDQLHAPTPDWEKWKRVRYWGVEHFTGFRYGDDHHVIAIAFVQDADKNGRNDSRSCLRRFESWVRPQIKSFDVKLGPVGVRELHWRDQKVLVQFVDGWVDTAFTRKEFSAAWAAYPAYPDTCLVYAMAVPWRNHAELAQQVRDRWVAEGFERMNPLTTSRPERK
jgi:hypothetical protein